jgi:glycerophosphoryl diester phosphodiesterase
MVIFLCAAVLVIIAYLLALTGRTGHNGLPALRGWAYAHRGLHGNGIPENSMAAFEAALAHGYGIELDIHLMKDGNLAVLHDSSLLRTAGVDVKIEDLTVQDLENYRLEGTDQKIPLFSQVLALYAGKAPMIIELKSERNNYDALTDAAVKAMECYEGVWCMESFDPRCVHSLKKNYPQVIRGQLSENFVKNPKSRLPLVLKWIMTLLLPNFLTQPDFVAYNCLHRDDFSNRIVRDFWGVQGVTWTLQSKDDYDNAVSDNWIPIFENFKP